MADTLRAGRPGGGRLVASGSRGSRGGEWEAGWRNPRAEADPQREAAAAAVHAEDRRKVDRVWSYTFSYLLGALLLGALIWSSGVWNFLANTRLLSVLIDSGVVSYHDAQSGFIRGVPDLKYFLKSSGPDQVGARRGRGPSLPALLADQGGAVPRLLPVRRRPRDLHAARARVSRGRRRQPASALQPGNGPDGQFHGDPGRAAPTGSPRRVFLGELFVGIEIVVYAAYGPYGLGWSVWLAQIFWSLVILGLLLPRGAPEPPLPRAVDHPAARGARSRRAFRALSRRPMEFSKLTVLSLLAFGLEDIAAYMIAMAFTSTHVILNVNFSILLMAIVASYIARLIPVTPGGIGQFEWGFAAGLYLGGLGWPECVTIAILDNFVRYASGTLLWVWVYILRVDYSFEVLKRVEPRAPEA